MAYVAGMNKGRRITGFALLAGVAIGLTFYVTRPREPMYQGRALSEWMAELNSYDPKQQTAHERATERFAGKVSSFPSTRIQILEAHIE